MTVKASFHRAAAIVTTCVLAGGAVPSWAGGGYFALGYGPLARQMAGATTAVAGDAYAGSSNPGKLFAAGDRVDLGLEFFNPHRRIEREGARDPAYDFSSRSRNDLFLIPEGAFSRRLGDAWAWGVTVYGNGGLNTEYPDTTGVPGTNFNPGECASKPANFMFGCGKLGFDLLQLVVAPTLAWQFAPGHSIGIAPLITLQRVNIYGFQAFAPLSKHPGAVTNRGNDYAMGGGVRIGWYGELTPWLSAGVAYATRTHMQEFHKYRGLFAQGSFDVPEIYSAGVAIKPTQRWLVSLDVQRADFGDVNALGNGVLNSLSDPVGQPLGGAEGSGFNWRNTNLYRLGLAFAATDALTLRAGWAHGRRPYDNDIDSVSFNLFAPNPHDQVSVGLSWKPDPRHELHLAMAHYLKGTYGGPSASAGLGVGGKESITPYVNTFMVAWSWLL